MMLVVVFIKAVFNTIAYASGGCDPTYIAFGGIFSIVRGLGSFSCIEKTSKCNSRYCLNHDLMYPM